MSRPLQLAVLALLAVAAVHYAFVPKTVWEYDESLFALGTESYQPLLHHPPPPGYPLYIAFAKFLALFTGDPFRALLVASILTLGAGLVTWFLAFREIAGGDVPIAALGTALLYLSPSLLVSGVLPQSDSGAIALFGLAAYACARRDPQFAAIACAACVGWRQQLAVAVVPMLLISLAFFRDWRERGRAIGTFAAGCVLWLIPLLVVTEGPDGFWKWLSGQAAYFASHDSNLSRGGYSASLVVLRFIAHPWGPKWLSIPLLALAAAGAVLLTLRRARAAWPLAGGCAFYLAFALATMDPADAVRYAIPSLPLIALAAAALLARLALIGVLVAAAYSIGAIEYALPVLRPRVTLASPPASAAAWILKNVPKNGVILYDLPLRPHAEYLLRDRQSMRVDAGMAKYGGNPAVPMAIFADGARGASPGVTFEWPDTDAYRKLTRQHYGAVSVIPLPPPSRYRVIEGISSPERTRDGTSWRWIGKRGVLELPDLGASHVRLAFHAPADYPLGENRLHVRIAGRDFATTVKARATSEMLLPIPRGLVRIEILPEKSFVPSDLPGAINRDRRMLSVMLTKVEQVEKN